MRILIPIMCLIMIVGCKKETDASTTVLSETIDTTAKLVMSGSFQNGPYGAVSGIGKVYKNYNGTYSILLDSFMTTNGPNLFVYLSKEAMPVNFISAGNLKSTTGSQVYNITEMPDIAQYKYICIHCKDYNHLFGYALLK